MARTSAGLFNLFELDLPSGGQRFFHSTTRAERNQFYLSHLDIFDRWLSARLASRSRIRADRGVLASHVAHLEFHTARLTLRSSCSCSDLLFDNGSALR